MSGETKRVILSGSDYEDHWQRRVPFDAEPYTAEKAWPTGLNVYEVPQQQYDGWVAAKKAYSRMQAEIRKLIRGRDEH